MVTTLYYFFKSEKDHEKENNLGYKGFIIQRRVDSVNHEDMKGSGDTNLPEAKNVRVYLKLIQFSPSIFFICFFLAENTYVYKII